VRIWNFEPASYGDRELWGLVFEMHTLLLTCLIHLRVKNCVNFIACLQECCPTTPNMAATCVSTRQSPWRWTGRRKGFASLRHPELETGDIRGLESRHLYTGSIAELLVGPSSTGSNIFGRQWAESSLVRICSTWVDSSTAIVTSWRTWLLWQFSLHKSCKIYRKVTGRTLRLMSICKLLRIGQSTC